ncbi:MAG: hypothetical protein U0R50_09810 [Gaiellales bacterium]
MATETKRDKDLIADLASRGQDALHRLTELPGGTTALKAFNDLRNRVDDLSRKVRGVEQLEARIADLEKDVATLKKSAKASAGT